MRHYAAGFLAFVLLIASFAILHSEPSKAIAAGADGKAIYDGKCAACHQATGQGTPGVFPPLAGNANVTASNPHDIIDAVKNGLNKPKQIAGKQYSGGMPAWKGQLSDAEIAAVITYVRSAWGNKASKVAEKDVASAK